MDLSLDTRRRLRTELRRKRRSLGVAQQALAAQKLVLRLGRNPWLRQARTLACYWPNDGEISPLPLIKVLRRRGKRVYLPVLHPHHNTLSFRLYQKGDALAANRFGIPEPPPFRPMLAPRALDLILMPLVGFDRFGNRLGMGGGFYDRSLAQLRGRSPKRIGLAHAVQQVSKLPIASWDVPLHAIVTDRGSFKGIW